MIPSRLGVEGEEGGPSSKVLTYIEQVVYPPGSEELGFESAVLSLGQPKILYRKKRGGGD